MKIFLSAPAMVSSAGMNSAAVFDAALRGYTGGIREVTLKGGRSFMAGRITDDAAGIPAAAAYTAAAPARIERITGAALEQLRPLAE
jgi:hypothetical protein